MAVRLAASTNRVRGDVATPSSESDDDVGDAEPIAYGGKMSWKDVGGLPSPLVEMCGLLYSSSYLQDSARTVDTGVNSPYDSPGADWYNWPWPSLKVYRCVSASYAMR